MKKSLDKRTKEYTETEKQLRKFLMSSKGFISIDEARNRLNKKWPKKMQKEN